MPELLPGILQLTRRARYLSFYAFLLAEYESAGEPAEQASLHAYIRRCEWDYGLAVLHCPRRCGSSPIGTRRLTPVVINGTGPYPRGESVKSLQGGYGLNYRAPLIDFGVVAREGTPLGGRPLPLDVLRRTEQAVRLADAFSAAVRNTSYYRNRMWDASSLTVRELEEFAEAACLCRLDEHAEERDAIRSVMLGEGTDRAACRRRASVAHFLTLIETEPDVVTSADAFRQALWEPVTCSHAHAEVAGLWAAVAAKDFWHQALCSIWTDFCASGSSGGEALTWDQAREIAYGLLPAVPPFHASSYTSDLIAALDAETVTLADEQGREVIVARAPLEQLRQMSRRSGTADSGMVLFLELMRRMEGRTGPGWERAASIRSRWQPSLSEVEGELRNHLSTGPTVGDTLWWLLRRFILEVHERIAYSKLPEFTFRFRWERGLLHFYDLAAGGLSPAGIRGEPLASLTEDLGLWHWAEGPEGQLGARLTDQGRRFVEEVLA